MSKSKVPYTVDLPIGRLRFCADKTVEIVTLTGREITAQEQELIYKHTGIKRGRLVCIEIRHQTIGIVQKARKDLFSNNYFSLWALGVLLRRRDFPEHWINLLTRYLRRGGAYNSEPFSLSWLHLEDLSLFYKDPALSFLSERWLTSRKDDTLGALVDLLLTLAPQPSILL